jgi:regulator of PEP synthase PpsR (kinase-PPPase family)
VIKIFTISDATGSTAESVVRAALVQFDASKVEISRRGLIQTAEQIRKIVDEAASVHGIIVHTFVVEELRHLILREGRSKNVTTIDLMGPLLARLSELLEVEPKMKPGGFRPFDSGYLERIEALDYSVKHDDGRNIHDLDQAEIVLIGVSRTSKTPLSIYLAYRGWKVANVPIVLGVDPPSVIYKLPRKRVVCLTIQPERLALLRKVRVGKLGSWPEGYADIDHVRKEVAYAYTIFEKRRDWLLVDVTTKTIEETAGEVVSLIGHEMNGDTDYKKILS